MRQLKIQKSITNRSSEALDKYLVEIGRAPLISIDEEIELAQKIKKGGREGERAKDKLVDIPTDGESEWAEVPAGNTLPTLSARLTEPLNQFERISS